MELVGEIDDGSVENDEARAQYQTWKSERNRARAALERRHGYDTKHAMHLIRLMRMGVEALERGELVVRREDSAELIAIRDGAMSFDELVAAATRLQGDMQRATARSTLPDEVDHEKMGLFAVQFMLEALA